MTSIERNPRRGRRAVIIASFIAGIAGIASITALAVVTVLPVRNTGDDKASIERGRELAEWLCRKCHALGPSGDSPNATAPPFRTLTKRLTLEGIEDELSEGIMLGHQPMPQWQFNAEQIYDLTSFIVSVSE